MMGGFVSVPLYANVNKNALQKILTAYLHGFYIDLFEIIPSRK